MKNYFLTKKCALVFWVCAPVSMHSCSHGALTSMPLSDGGSTRSDLVKLRFLNQMNIPTGEIPKGVALKSPFGGISAAAPLDPVTFKNSDFKVMMLSDDRSSFGPARAYEAVVGFDASGLPTLSINTEIELKNASGSVFEKNSVDPEGLYISPTGKFFMSQEGSLTEADVWFPPSLVEISKFGHVQSALQLPSYIFPDAPPTSGTPDKNNVLQKSGQRYNLSLEGLSGAKGWLFAALEGPLMQDSALATFDNPGFTRIFKHDIKNEPKRESNDSAAAAYFYQVEPLRKDPSFPKDTMADVNGVSEILFWDEFNGLVLERGGVILPDKSYETQLFLYQVDLNGATNVLTCASKVTECSDAKPISKKLVLDFSTIQSQLDPAYPSIDNLEAMFFGPLSPSGAKTLWLISDNNFSKIQRTQILVFEIL